jgi:hypothetical protein
MMAVLDESPSWSWIVLRATSPVDWMLDLLAFLAGISSRLGRVVARPRVLLLKHLAHA